VEKTSGQLLTGQGHCLGRWVWTCTGGEENWQTRTMQVVWCMTVGEGKSLAVGWVGHPQGQGGQEKGGQPCWSSMGMASLEPRHADFVHGWQHMCRYQKQGEPADVVPSSLMNADS
jgi:hypothetical protein